MITLIQFIQFNNLQQVDAIILRKKLLGMVDHYALFLGFRGNSPIFIANYRDGVKEVSNHEMHEVLQTLEPTKIERFHGTDIQRKQAINRALSRIGEKAYNYVTNNCEHFKNWVFYGKNFSNQVKSASKVSLTLALGAGLFALATKNAKVACIAIGLLLIGLILKDSTNE